MKGDIIKAKKFCILVFLFVGMMLGGCKDSQDSVKDSPIHTAALFGNLDEIESILAEKTELVNAKDEEGDTPLHLAVSIFGNKEVVKLLITKGADVNAKNKYAATPLHNALSSVGNKEIAELLIDNGADVNSVEDMMGATPLHFATDRGFKETVELLISKGADINAKDKIGGTALHHLTQEGQEDDTDMIEFLLAKGANINAKDNVMGGTPLHYASMNGYKNIVKFLIDNGADIYCKAHGEATPLMLAVSEGRKDVADLLHKHMKDVSDLLHAIGETGYDDKGVLFFTERLKKVAPVMNKQLGNALKQDFTFDWYVGRMIELKMAEQMFRAIDMSNFADEVGKLVEFLEIAWSASDLHDILDANFHAKDVDAVLNKKTENMSEEQKQQLTVDNIPVKELAKRLLEQAVKEK